MQPEPGDLQLELDSSPLAVRGALTEMTAYLRGRCPEEGLAVVEIVLAEALNNIVEHAYVGGTGRITLCLRAHAGDVQCCIADHGLPMPGGAAPSGRLRLSAPGAALPEGGFGWHLIRSLSQDVDYRRVSGRNYLSLRVQAGQ